MYVFSGAQPTALVTIQKKFKVVYQGMRGHYPYNTLNSDPNKKRLRMLSYFPYRFRTLSSKLSVMKDTSWKLSPISKTLPPFRPSATATAMTIRIAHMMKLCSYYPSSRLPTWKQIAMTAYQGGLNHQQLIIRYRLTAHWERSKGPTEQTNKQTQRLKRLFSGQNKVEQLGQLQLPSRLHAQF